MKLAVLSAVAAMLVAACATPAATTPAAPAAAPAVATAPKSPDPVSAQPPAGTQQANAIPGVELTNATDGRKVTVKRGNEVKLVLDLNPVQELAWELEKAPAPTLDQIGERIYIGRGSNGYDILAGGVSIYRFRAEQPGTATLTLTKHSRADGKALATVHYDVTVE